jgi:3-oxoacyl-[acyl-carrier protein] reductase
MNINDAKVIITGATSGIGYETAKVLKKHGAQVVISGRNDAKLQKAIKELDTLGFVADVTKEEDIKALFDFAIKSMGTINVLINNAGIGSLTPLTETTLKDFQNQWEVNTKGMFLAGREAAKHFI